MANVRKFFGYFDEGEDLVRLAVKIIRTDYSELLYRKYGEDLSKFAQSGITRTENNTIYGTIIPEVLEALDFLKQNYITLSNASQILAQENKIEVLRENFLILRNQTLPEEFFSYFDKEKVYVKIAVLMLHHTSRASLYRKCKESLTESEKISELNTLFYKITLILKFLDTKNFSVDEAYLILNDSKEIKLLKDEYENSVSNNMFFSSFTQDESLVRLAVILLEDKYISLLKKKYGESLTEYYDLDNLTVSENSIIKSTVNKKIIYNLTFLEEQNIDENLAKQIIEDPKEIENLKMLLKSKVLSVSSKNFFSYFNESEDLVYLAVRMIPLKYAQILYRRYGENLKEVYEIRENSKEIYSLIHNTIITRIKNILKFLNTKNISDQLALEYISDEEKLNSLLLEYLKYSSKNNSNYKAFFSYFMEDEKLVCFAVKILSEDKSKLLYTRYGKNLKFLYGYNLLTIEENHFVSNVIIDEVKSIIRYVKENNINYIANFDNEEVINNIREKLLIRNNNKGYEFFKKFNYGKNLVSLAVKILDQDKAQLLYEKFGKNLDKFCDFSNVTPSEASFINLTIIPEVKIILSFLSDVSIDEIKASEIINDLDEIRHLRTLYNNFVKVSNNKVNYLFDESSLFVNFAVSLLIKSDKDFIRDCENKSHNEVVKRLEEVINLLKKKDIATKTLNIDEIKKEVFLKIYNIDPLDPHYNFLVNFNASKNVVKLAIMFLNSKERDNLFKLYGEDLSEISTLKLEKRDLIISKVNNILRFLKIRGIYTDQEALKYLDKDLSTLANDYKEYNNSNKKYKSLASVLNSSINLIRLSVIMLGENDRKLVYLKYGNTLDDLNIKGDLTKEDDRKIRLILADKVSKILEFLSYKGIDENNAFEYFDEEKLKLLRGEFYNYNSSIKHEKLNLFSFFNVSESFIKLSLYFLSESSKVFLYNMFGLSLNEIVLSKDISPSEMSTLNKIIIPKIRKVLEFFVFIDLGEEEAKNIVQNFNILKIRELNQEFEKYNNLNFSDKIRSDSFIFKEFHVDEKLVRLAIMIIRPVDRNILVFNTTLKSFKSKKITDKVGEIIDFLQYSNITPNDALVLVRSPKLLQELREKYEKFNKEDINNNAVSLLDIFGQYEAYLLKLAVLLLDPFKRRVVYECFGQDLNIKFNIEDNSIIKSDVIDSLRKIVIFLINNNIDEKRAIYLMSTDGEESFKELKKLLEQQFSKDSIFLNQLNNLSISVMYCEVVSIYGRNLGFAIIALDHYKESVTSQYLSYLLNIGEEEILEAYKSYIKTKRLK